jgi:beta-lactamase superfamily II metal-dependent hydrolase
MSGETLRVRVYNVRFGDAILVTVPDRGPDGTTTTRRILIDLGNAPLVANKGGGADDSVFAPVLADILEQLDGHHLDLYVMTHEHLDHTQGLPYAAMKVLGEAKFKQQFVVDNVWMTASADPDYATKFPNTVKKMEAHQEQVRQISAYLGAAGMPAALASYLLNNNPARTTECVEFLRELNPAKTTYVHRETSLAGTHPFQEATFEIWAPEEDASEYYGRLKPLALGVSDAAAPATSAGGATTPTARARKPKPVLDPVPEPPRGVDLGSFLNLVASRRTGVADNLLAIDKAANNTSLVFLLSWRGWRLLFAGDAEKKSWARMQKEGVLKPVHFLKVSHHGSHNGTPEDATLEQFLPVKPHDRRNRSAAISTWTETYGGIPHTETNDRLKSRAALQTTLDSPEQLFYNLEFPDS